MGATGFASQVAPSAEVNRPISIDSCSTTSLMERVTRKTGFAASLTSSASLSPLAVTTVFSGTRKASSIAILFYRSGELDHGDKGHKRKPALKKLTLRESIKKLPQQPAEFRRLLESGIVARLGDDLQSAAGDLLPHQLEFTERDAVFAACDEQCGHIDCRQRCHRIGALGHPALHASDVFRRHALHHLARRIDDVRPVRAGGRRQQLGKHFCDEAVPPLMQHSVGKLQPVCLALGCLGSGTRIRQHQRCDLLAVSAPELEKQITTDGYANKERLADSFLATQLGQVVGELLHGSGTFAQFGVAMPAQVGKNQPVSRTELRCYWVPEVAVQRERVQQHDVGAVAGDFIKELRIAAAE